MEDERYSENKNATFIIRVLFNQNATWQGEIKWADNDSVQYFRSDVELIELMNDALKQTFNRKSLVQWENHA